MLRSGAFLPAAIAVLLASGAARAYCRSTSCSGDCPRDDNGCKTTGKPLAWPGACVGFSIQKDGTMNLPSEVVRPIIEKAFVAWSSVACDGGGDATIAFSQLADASCHEAQFDPKGPNANIILFQDDKWTFDGLDDTIARTTVSFDTATGAIQDADIQLNYAYNNLTTGDTNVVYDLQSVLTHEVGHFIGFDHSPDPSATMYATYDEGTTTQRTLGSDDVAGLCDVYAPTRTARCDPTPQNGFSADCSVPATKSGGCALTPAEPATRSLSALAVLATVAFARRASARARTLRTKGAAR